MMISKTISTKKVSATINYLLKEKAHNTNLVDHRNLDISMNNLSLDGGGEVNSAWFMCQFSASRSLAKNKKKTYQGEHVIMSFSKDDFDCSDVESQSKQAVELMNGFFEEYFPKESQYFMVSQADNDGQNLHIHAVVNTVNIDGKVLNTNLTSQTRSGAFRDSVNKYLGDNFERVTGRSYKPVLPTERSKIGNAHSSLAHIRKRGAYSWKEDLQTRIVLAMQKFKNYDDDDDDIETILNDAGVSISKKRRSIGKDENGSKVYRDAWTYSFIDETGQERKARDFAIQKNGKKTGLGEGFTPEKMRSHAKYYSKRRKWQQDMANQFEIKNHSKKNDNVSSHAKSKDDGLSF